MFPKSKTLLLLFFLLIFSTQSVQPQTNSKNKKKPTKTISLGVINVRAIDLVKPEFPQAAWEMGIYGLVKIGVLIDEKGNVFSAKKISGNLVLISAATNAALQSKFIPLKIGDQPVKVAGIIHYNFIPDQFNWLETGYILGSSKSNFYSVENLIDRFPVGFQEENNLLKQSNNEKIKKSVIALIQNDLLNDKNSFWLFSVGLNLAQAQNHWKTNEYALDETSDNFQNLKPLVAKPPRETKVSLLENLQKFIDAIEENKTDEGFSILNKLETNFPLLGK